MDKLSRQLAEIAAVHVLQSETEFSGCSRDSLEMLVDFTLQYIERLALLCHGQCNHSGRTVGTPADLLWSLIPSSSNLTAFLEEMATVRQLSTRNPLDLDARLQTLAEKMQDGSIEFMGPLSDTAGHRESLEYNQWMSVDKSAPDEMPSFAFPHAPPLPDKHSYKQTAVYVPRETDPALVRQKAVEKNEYVQASLKKLIQACDGSIVDIFSITPPLSQPDANNNGNDVIDITEDRGQKLKLPVIHYERYRAEQYKQQQQRK